MERKEGVWADEEESYRIAFCGFVSAESAGLSYEGQEADTDWGNEAKDKKKVLSTEQPLKPISASICNIYNHNAAIGSHLYSLGGIEDVGSNSSEDSIESWRLELNSPIRQNDFTCAVLESKKEILLAKHFVNDDDNLYFATFYAFNVVTRCWTTLMPLKRKLHGCFPCYVDRRAVAVGTTLYWGAFSQDSHEKYLFYVQAYDLDKDVWLWGRLNTRPLFRKHEGPRSFDRSPRLLHLRDHIFCLLLHGYLSSSHTTSYLYCLVVNIEPISTPMLSDSDDDDADEDDDDDDHLHKLSISIISVQKYPLNEVSSLWDNVLLP
ncbi:hypothetical protein SO802_027990 [Lithocarpus litseifolius]|uniref:Uncharacterized protein n=1 Tax=Lithocarpus litseifolius TaxID=425828 RepID=A0AAW2BNZ1_9ROSI